MDNVSFIETNFLTMSAIDDCELYIKVFLYTYVYIYKYVHVYIYFVYFAVYLTCVT